MERVETLCERLKEQIEKKVSIDELLMTVQMLQSELLHLKSNASNSQVITSINIDIPSIPLNPQVLESPQTSSLVPPKIEFILDDIATEEQEKNTNEIVEEVTDEKAESIVNETHSESIPVAETNNEEVIQNSTPLTDEPKVFITLELDETALEEELQQIKKSAEIKNTISAVNKPLMLFDPLEDIPTLSHQRTDVNTAQTSDANSQQSINDVLRQENNHVSEHLNNEPIKDLKKAISINDRFLFINELFNGDELTYDRSIKAINAFSIYPEAEYWIRRELKIKFAWDEKSSVVKQFNHLVKRRFSAI